MVTRKPESKTPDRRTRAGRALAAFEAFEGEFAKHFGPNVLRRSNEVPKYEVVSTGSITLDYAMGSGGYIEGRITEMWGPDGTGKTTLSLIAIANAQAKYPDRMCAFIDVEHKLDLGWAVKLGVDLTRMYVVQPPSAEDVADIVKALISSDVVSFIVLDSIGAMTANEEFDKDAGEVSVGTTPKVITRMVKIAGSRLQQHRCGLLLINQVRANLGYGADTTTGGGFARAHSTTQRLKVRRAMKGEIKLGSGDDAVVIGFKIAVKVEKNQAASPGRTAMVTIINQTTDKHPEYGVSDRPGEAFEVGKKTGVIGRRGPTYILPDGSEHKGEIATRAYLEQNPDLVETIRQQLLAMIADGGATKAIPVDDEDDEAAAEFAGDDDEVPAVDLDAAAAAPTPAEDDEEMDV